MFIPMTHEGAYFLGLLSTDGNVYKNTVRIELQYRDRDILEKFVDILTSYGYSPKLSNSSKNGRLYSKLSIHSKFLVELLSGIGITNNKSFSIRFFDWIDLPYLIDYIRGCIDGDGSIYHKKDHNQNFLQFEICSASKLFIHGFNLALLKFNISPKTLECRTRNRKSDLYRISLYSKEAHSFLEQIYYPGCISINRKLSIVSSYIPSIDGRFSWKKEMEDFLLNNIDILSAKEIATYLGMTEKSVITKRWRLRKQYRI